MQTLVITVHIIACIFLIIFVLLQSGKEDMGVIFGGGSGSVFGSTGAGGILSKVTAFLAAVFLITSLSYNYLAGNKVGDDSVMLNSDSKVVLPAPEFEKPAIPAKAEKTVKTEKAANTQAPVEKEAPVKKAK